MSTLSVLGQVPLANWEAFQRIRNKMLRILRLLESREIVLIPWLSQLSDAFRWLLEQQANATVELYLRAPAQGKHRTSELLIRLLADDHRAPLPEHLSQAFLKNVLSISNREGIGCPDYIIPVPVWVTPDAALLERIKAIFIEQSRDELVSALEDEKAKAESLLLNILPQRIVERIKSEEGVIFDYHPETTILFTDMVGFTEIASHMDAHRVVTLIDHIFRRFDDLCDQYQVEKIKTIGDSYMAAAGVPLAVENHAERMADLALDMLATHTSVVQEEGVTMDLRIGLHSGPVVAGVIGHRKYAYDLWGDTVNVASRMESTGVPGEIQISVVTRELLPARFLCDIRGNVALKGHGSIEAFLLRGRNRTKASHKASHKA